MTAALDIKLKTLGIASVLQQYRLRVPKNQRPYAWKDDQVKQLFADWKDARAAKAKLYFLGTIVLNKTPTEIKEVSDGQQRLATTCIFIAALRDYLAARGPSERRTAEKYTRNHLIEFEELEGDWSPRLQLNTQDNSFFRQCILIPPSERGPDQPQPERRSSNERLARAYDVASITVKDLAGSVSSDYSARYLYEWIKFLTDDVVVITIEVPEDVDAFTMFETLNDRGARASQVDNIKNRIFKEAGGRLDEVEDMWLSMISQIESFGDDSTVLDYVRHYWISERGPTLERDLAKEFRDKLKGQAEVASFVKSLDDKAADYQALFFNPLEHSRLDNFSTDVRCYVAGITSVLGITQIRPLMLAVLRRLDKAEAAKTFRMMLSWSVRYVVVGSGGGGNLDKYYGEAAADVSRGNLRSAKDLKERFSRLVPTDSQFEASFKIHSISNETIARYVLRSFEGYARGEENPQIRHFDNPAVASLEHVIPQKRSEGWGYLSEETCRAFYKRVGNLALLAAKPNSKIGNLAFKEKIAAYQSSPFNSTRELAEAGDWGPQQVEERQARMAGYAPKVWPL